MRKAERRAGGRLTCPSRIGKAQSAKGMNDDRMDGLEEEYWTVLFCRVLL